MRIHQFSRTVMVAVCTAFIFLIAMSAGASAMAHDKDRSVVSSGLPATVGLAIDARGNYYTAEPGTGYVFCIQQDAQPILLARVPGTPTSLAVDSLRNVFVATQGGVVYAIELDGTVTEACRCGGEPVGLSINRDGDIVVALEAGEIIRIERVGLMQR